MNTTEKSPVKPDEKKAELSKQLEATAKDASQGGSKNLPAVAENQKNKSEGEMFSEFMQRHQRDFEMVVPRHLKPERIMRIAIAACKRNPALMKCWMPSIVGGALEASALGLEINTPLQQAWLVPFKNNLTKRSEAELIIGFQGYIELMYNNPKVLSIFASVVYTNDILVYEYGTEEKLVHHPLEIGDVGNIRGFYAYAKMTDGAYRFIFMPKQEVDNVRDTFSASYKAKPEESPWTSDYISMGCKTAIRKLQKYVPKSAECQRAVDADFKVIDPFDPSYLRPEDKVETEIAAEKPKPIAVTGAGKEGI